MKRLLCLLVIAGTSSACKKSRKADIITPETLLGTWSLPGDVLSDIMPDNYTFRADSSFIKNMGGFVGTINGTYSTTSKGDHQDRFFQ